MKVTVKLFATFRDGREKVQVMELDDDTTVEDVVEMLKIVKSEIAILLINGRDGKLMTSLSDGDTLALFPPVGGG